MISFIVPVYNGEKYIERSLRSIINNTSGTYEIIVVNDGSTDSTLEIINRMKEQYCEIKIISQKNSGVSSARETGIREAIGEWIVFVDADDYIISDIAELIRVEQDEKCDWIVFSGQFHESIMFDLNRNDCKKDVITAILNQNQEAEIRAAKLNTVWSKAYRRNIIKEYGIQFEKSLKHGEDMVFNLDYVKNCNRICFYSESVYMLCANENSATHSYQKDCVKNDKNFFWQLNKREVFDLDSDLTECYYRMVLNGIWICLGQYFSHQENKKGLNERGKELASFLKQEPYKTALVNYSVEGNKGKRIAFALLNLHFYKFVLKMAERLRKLSRKNVIGSIEI